MRLTQRPGRAGGKSQEKCGDVQRGLILEFLGEKESLAAMDWENWTWERSAG